MITKALLIAIIVLMCIIGIGGIYAGIRFNKMNKTIDRLENKINLQENNYGKGKQLIVQEMKDPRVDTLLKLAKIKPKNVQAITNVHYHNSTIVKNDSIIAVNDTSVCIDYNYKGFRLSGCNGVYEDDRTFNATGILHRKPTKKFLFIHYCKKPVLQSWTEYGDTLQINLIERK